MSRPKTPAPAPDAPLVALPGAVTQTAVAVGWAPTLTRQQWLAAGQLILALNSRMPWLIGDWFNAGRQFIPPEILQTGTDAEIDQATAALIALTDQREQVAVCAWVSRSVPRQRRRAGLSWAHHREVADLRPSDQMTWLDKFERDGLAIADVRERLREQSPVRAIGPGEEKPIHRFILPKWCSEVRRWFTEETSACPINEWPKERRAAVKREFAPILEFLQRL